MGSRSPASGTDHTACLIGVTGGFGAGKSTVCKLIEERFPVLYSDAIARELMEADSALRSQLRSEFGLTIFSSKNKLDREKLAEMVFTHPHRLEQLNRIVHPVVIEHLHHEADKLLEKGHRIIFVESALIFEAGIEDMFKFILCVITKRAEIINRLQRAHEFSREQIDARLLRQMDPETKADESDFTIRNNGSMEELRRNVSFILTLVEARCLQPR